MSNVIYIYIARHCQTLHPSSDEDEDSDGNGVNLKIVRNKRGKDQILSFTYFLTSEGHKTNCMMNINNITNCKVSKCEIREVGEINLNLVCGHMDQWSQSLSFVIKVACFF